MSDQHRGVLVDLSRGRIPKVAYLKKVIRLLADYGINQVQLYMEHTFRFSFFETINQGKDGYGKEEIKALDDFCYELGIELIPCIVTFGHMFEILQSDQYNHLCELPKIERPVYSWLDRQLHHTIDSSNKESIQLIEKMIQEIATCYRSPYLNISGDETYDIGKGKSKAYVERIGKTNAYIHFLNQILAISQKYGKRPMYWGDMILRNKEKIHQVDKNAVPMHWWYESTVEEEDFIKFEELNCTYYTCPSTAGWNHFSNDYKRSIINMNQMIGYGKKHGAAGVLITDWGDFGHINHLSNSIPMLIYGAKKALNPKMIATDWYQELMSKAYYELMLDVGNERTITFEGLMKWYYEFFNNDCAYGSMVDEIKELTYEKMVISLENIDGYLNRLERIKEEPLCDLITSRKVFKNNLEGMKWMVLVFIYVKEHIYQCACSYEGAYRMSSLELVDYLRNWYLVFHALWLENNRESECYRVGQVIENICNLIEKG